MAVQNNVRYEVKLSSQKVDSVNFSKKRKMNVDQWQDNVAKVRRNSGEDYVGRNGNHHDELDPPHLVINMNDIFMVESNFINMFFSRSRVGRVATYQAVSG